MADAKARAQRLKLAIPVFNQGAVPIQVEHSA
jgi:hypothetical protein